MLGYLTQKEGVLPVVRVPLTAAYWLNVNVPSTYPDLGGQYRTLISRIVEFWTANNVAVILDLHWNDDSSKQQPMALKGSASAIDFWGAVARQYGSNKRVMFELYNEPHLDSFDTFANGDATYAGMLEMYQTVRAVTSDSMIVYSFPCSLALRRSSLPLPRSLSCSSLSVAPLLPRSLQRPLSLTPAVPST
jgi:hypothetical protein